MTRRVQEDRQPDGPPAQTEAPMEPSMDPPRPVRVAGVVREGEVNELERIAGALEVATWIKRMSMFARARNSPTRRTQEPKEPKEPKEPTQD